MTPTEIKRIRLRLKWSQERFARELGVSFSTVNRWERGKTLPSPMAVLALKRLGSGTRLVDRRSAVRLKKSVPVRVFGHTGSKARGQKIKTEDISVTGLMFKGPKAITPGQKLLFGFCHEEPTSVTLISEVMWTAPGGKHKYIGVRFDQVTPSDMAEVVKTILRH